ncbi:MAG: type II secretion system F family protein [Angustibacter sp.]
MTPTTPAATPTVIAVLAFVVLGLAVAGAAVLTAAVHRGVLVSEAAGDVRTGPLLRVRRRVDAWVIGTGPGRRLRDKLAGADVAVSPTGYLGLLGCLVLSAVVLGRELLGLLGSVVVVVAVVAAADRLLRHRQERRVEAFVGQLPDVARVVANAASAGLALRQAITVVSREVDDPAGHEFALVAEQLALGFGLDRALIDVDRRLPSRELRVLVQTLVIQSRSGGALVAALTTIAATLEQRKELRREVRTAVSGAVFSGYVVAALGTGSVFVMNLISPGALDVLARTSVGRVVLLAAAALFLVGFLVIRRITTVEV